MSQPAQPLSLASAPRSISGNPRECIVEWYRADRLREMIRVFIAGAFLVVIGGLICGAAYSNIHLRHFQWQHIWLAIGVCCVLSGPLSTVYRLHILLGEELYIALCSDGVAFCHEADIDFFSWDHMMSASYDPTTETLSLHMREQAPFVIKGSFRDILTKDIADRINTIRTKSLWGTLYTSEY